MGLKKSPDIFAKYLIDSVILIDHLRGISQATDWLSSLAYDEGVISVITRAEVLVGAEAQEAGIRLLLDGYNCLSLDWTAADMAAKLRNQWRIKLPDAFQLALAEKNDLILVTRDHGDFGKVAKSRVKIPYSL